MLNAYNEDFKMKYNTNEFNISIITLLLYRMGSAVKDSQV